MPALPRLSNMLSRSPRTLASAVCALLLVLTGVLTVGVAARATRVPLQKTTAHNAGQLHQQMQELRLQSEVAMSTQEMALVEQYLSPELNMLEWGSGHSTLYYSQVGPRVLPVSSDTVGPDTTSAAASHLKFTAPAQASPVLH